MSTWVDLGDLYVKKAGDTVSGSILMANNNLSVAYDSDTTYNVGAEIKSLRDSVSSIQKVPTNNTTYSMWYCSNGLCIFSVYIEFNWSSWGYLTLTNNEKIEEKYRPAVTCYFPTTITNKDKSNLGDIGLEVGSNGVIKLRQVGGQWLNTTDKCTVGAFAVWPCAAQVS